MQSLIDIDGFHNRLGQIRRRAQTGEPVGDKLQALMVELIAHARAATPSEWPLQVLAFKERLRNDLAVAHAANPFLPNGDAPARQIRIAVLQSAIDSIIATPGMPGDESRSLEKRAN